MIKSDTYFYADITIQILKVNIFISIDILIEKYHKILYTPLLIIAIFFYTERNPRFTHL